MLKRFKEHKGKQQDHNNKHREAIEKPNLALNNNKKINIYLSILDLLKGSNLHFLTRAAGKAQALQRLFWRWKLRRPHRTQRVCVLFLLLPKLPVPFPYKTNTSESYHQATNAVVYYCSEEVKGRVPFLLLLEQQKPYHRGQNFMP